MHSAKVHGVVYYSGLYRGCHDLQDGSLHCLMLGRFRGVFARGNGSYNLKKACKEALLTERGCLSFSPQVLSGWYRQRSKWDSMERDEERRRAAKGSLPG